MWFLYTMGGVFFWSVALVLDSLLVHNYNKNPFVLMWTQSCVSIMLIPVLLYFIPFQTSHALLISIAAAIAYAGDITLFVGLEKVEASVINISWAILTVILGVFGVILFQESWTMMQTLGSVLVLSGVLLLALWHKHFTFSHAFLLLGLALLYAPTNLAEKYSVFHGSDVYTVLLWSFAVREVISFVFPWLVPKPRAAIISYLPKLTRTFVLLSIVILLSYIIGKFLIIMSMAVGQISLIAVAWNTQPFVVMFMAYLLWLCFPKKASKELFTQQTVLVKSVSFVIVAVGASLLIL